MVLFLETENKIKPKFYCKIQNQMENKNEWKENCRNNALNL